MPEKRYKKGCGPDCIRCWVNNLKHGNPQAKAYLKKKPDLKQWAVYPSHTTNSRRNQK